jgi:hypothetical protein
MLSDTSGTSLNMIAKHIAGDDVNKQISELEDGSDLLNFL